MQKIQLSIPEPCHENWHKMTPTEQGRYCNSCAKEVIDFAMMTDGEVLNYFSSLSNSKVCGRVLPSQLDREISRPREPRKRLFWYWNYVAMFFLFFSKSNLLKAQKGKIRPEVVTTPTCTKTMGIMVRPVSGEKLSHQVKGKVVDKNNAPVPYASIRIKGNKTGISADLNGNFTITVFNTSVLLVSAAGYNDKEIPAGKLESITIQMEAYENLLRGDVVVNTLAGGISFRDPEEKLTTPVKPKHVDEFVVKDMNGNTPLANVSLLFIKTGTVDKVESGLSDQKGVFKLKRSNLDDGYNIKVSAAGYESTEFTITGKEFNERKKSWEILLVKQAVPETRIRMGQVTTISKVNEPIYVIDGIIRSTDKDLDPADIRDITLLNGAEASAIFGAQGINGAIVITTKQSLLGQTKNLDTVKINAHPMKGMLKIFRSSTQVSLTENTTSEASLSDLTAPATLTVYPNPVSRGQQFYLDLSSLPAGRYEIRIYQSSGVLMEKKPLTLVPGGKRTALSTGANWTPGRYFLVIADEQGKNLEPHSFIVL